MSQYSQYLPISILNSYDYCQYQIYLQHVLKIKLPATRQMKQGTERHGELETKFLEEAHVIEEPIDEYIIKVKDGLVDPFITRELYVKSESHKIHGYIDEAHVFKDRVVIIDDKAGYKPYLSYVRQVRAYSIAFDEMFSWDRDIVYTLRNRDTLSVFFEEPMSNENRNETISTIRTIHDLINRRREFTSTTEQRKCKSCRFNTVCDKSLV